MRRRSRTRAVPTRHRSDDAGRAPDAGGDGRGGPADDRERDAGLGAHGAGRGGGRGGRGDGWRRRAAGSPCSPGPATMAATVSSPRGFCRRPAIDVTVFLVGERERAEGRCGAHGARSGPDPVEPAETGLRPWRRPDHRRAVRRRARPTGGGRSRRGDRRRQRKRRSDPRGRPAERRRRPDRRDPRPCDRGARDGHLLPPEARPSPDARPDACRRGHPRRYRHRPGVLRDDQADGVPQQPEAVARRTAAAAARRPQVSTAGMPSSCRGR